MVEQIRPNIDRLIGQLPPDILLERVVIQPIDARAKPGTADIHGFVLKTVYYVDKALEHAARNSADNLVEYVRFSDTDEEASLERTQRAQNEILAILHDALLEDPHARVIGLTQGVTPALVTLWNMENSEAYRGRIESTHVSGYSGEQTASAKVLEPLSPENQYASLIYILDDLWDTGHELVAVLKKIEELRGIVIDDSAYESLSALLKATRDRPYEEIDMELYDYVIERFHDAGAVIAQIFYKNRPFYERLRLYVENHKNEDAWCRKQEKVLKPARLIRQRNWVQGEGLDTDVNTELILDLAFDLLPNDMKRDAPLQDLKRDLMYTKLRIGSFVDGLIKMNRSDKNDLMKFVAERFAESICEWARVGYRWENMYPVYNELPEDWIDKARAKLLYA